MKLSEVLKTYLFYTLYFLMLALVLMVCWNHLAPVYFTFLPEDSRQFSLLDSAAFLALIYVPKALLFPPVFPSVYDEGLEEEEVGVIKKESRI